jgi:type II secretory pathway pseudopilin PulG
MVLFALSAIGLMLAGAGQVWHTSVQRDKEADLLFVGNEYRQAIASYYDSSNDSSNGTAGTGTSAARQYPRSLQDLLEDRRFLVTKRHLRKLYHDPMTNNLDWGLVRSGDRITGVYSRSQAAPLRKNHAGKNENFNGAERYSDWVFSANTAAP